ncbi:MAG: hypothetical protein KDI53_17145 [Candidatus Accumulibacter sp.]|nr:hypothetical protein [Accumulibacter sp.]
MAAFNYHQLVRLVPARTWQFYFEARKIDLPVDHDWAMPFELLVKGLIVALEALDADLARTIYAELRRVHTLANRRGMFALRNAARPEAALHEDFAQLTSDAERALWTMLQWPDLFDTADAFLSVDLQIGVRGWKRLKISPCDQIFRGPEEINALRLALASAFTPRKGTLRACEIVTLDRHLDGGVQFGILIEDNPQRKAEFGDDDRVRWRDIRPPESMDVVIYPASGVIDILAPGGERTRKILLTHFAQHVFKRTIQPQAIAQPMFFLNRLREGFELFDDSEVDLAAHRVEHIRLSQVRVRSKLAPSCDYLIKPPGAKDAPDVLACVQSQGLEQTLMRSAFNIVEATVTLHFLPVGTKKRGRAAHIELKQGGISNLRDLTEDEAKLAEALLQAWGVMERSLGTADLEEAEAPAELPH